MKASSGAIENAVTSTCSLTEADPISKFDDEPLLFEDHGQLWWRAFMELQKQIPKTRLDEAWVEAHHLKTDAREDTIAHSAINNLIIALEGTNTGLLKHLSPLMLVSIQQILDIAKIVQSTLDFKTGGFIWTCLSNVIIVSLSFNIFTLY
jgi:hypothetical protein